MPHSRPLTPGEIALAATIFYDAIDYSAARIAHSKWIFFQPRHVTMAPRGTIHFHPKGVLYREDYSSADLGLQALFLHEMTHIWQHQQGIFLPLRRHPFCRYAYSIRPGQPFRRYGLEQQAMLVQHTFLLRAAYPIPGAPALAVYESILPFRGTFKTSSPPAA